MSTVKFSASKSKRTVRWAIVSVASAASLVILMTPSTMANAYPDSSSPPSTSSEQSSSEAPTAPPSSPYDSPAQESTEWTPTQNPRSTIVPGKMRSDRQEVPKPFTKADADKAETLEAKVSPNGQTARAAVTAGCQVYWPAPYEVCGAIRDKYNQMNGPNSFLLYPKSNELTNPNNTGKRSEFLGGHIYWSSATGAKPVAHDFLTKYGDKGYESGFLKYPTTDEILISQELNGRRQEFQGGSIYYSTKTGAHNVQGLIRDKWISMGGPSGANSVGYPTQDEHPVTGRLATTYSVASDFETASLFYNPKTKKVDVLVFESH